MINSNDFNPNINHHIKAFRNRKLGRTESFDLVMYKYIRLEYVLDMLDTHVLRFNNINKWDDVYENFVDKEDLNLLNSKHEDMSARVVFGQSWTTCEESDAMWRIYSKDDKSAVRVMTVYPLFVQTLLEWNEKHKDNILFETTDYVSYADEKEINEWILSNTPMNFWAFNELRHECLFIKRLEFDHEKEVRVIFTKTNSNNEEYIGIDFDPHHFFREIVIDPRVNDNEYIQRRASLIEHGFDGNKIRKSTLYDFKKVKIDIDMTEPCDFQITSYSQKDGKPVQETVFMKGPETPEK